FYQLLALQRTASASDVKLAYHRALLLWHPDKRSAPASSADVPTAVVDIALLKEAYNTLSHTPTRAAYDALLNQRHSFTQSGPRPAQVISLEDFAETEAEGDGDHPMMIWTYSCRCGGLYRINEEDMEAERHMVGCTTCSEVVWVGYEIAEDEGGDEG
ncbi:hypothetical protein BV22DRAFT_1007280, partial [Leucogyrophana mollusca]